MPKPKKKKAATEPEEPEEEPEEESTPPEAMDEGGGSDSPPPHPPSSPPQPVACPYNAAAVHHALNTAASIAERTTSGIAARLSQTEADVVEALRWLTDHGGAVAHDGCWWATGKAVTFA